MIEDNHVSRFIVDPEVQAEFAANPKQIYNAYCWGTLNQGLLRKAKDILRKQDIDRFRKEWAELELVTEGFRKGAVLSIQPPEEPGTDRFAGFRNRLTNKHAWLFGYLCKEHEVLVQELVDHEKSDPLYKVLHRVRPSRKDQVVDEVEKNFLTKKHDLQRQLDDTIGHLVTWNTYFGWQQMES